MDYRKKFVVEPGAKVRLSKIDASYTGNHETHEAALPEIQKHIERLDRLQNLLYADGKQSLLIVLQALDAAGKGRGYSPCFQRHEPARNIRLRIQAAEQRGSCTRFRLAGASARARQG